MLVQCHILLIMCFQRNHKPVGMGVGNRLLKQKSSVSVPLFFRGYRQVDDVQTLFSVRGGGEILSVGGWAEARAS